MNKLASILGILSVVALAHAAEPPARKPNILFILADDLGWQDVGYNAVDDFIETPNIDKLARQGMVFTDAYSSMANCAPSRSCLISGTYTPRHGVYAVAGTKRGPVNRMRLEPIPNTNRLAKECGSFARELKKAGYATGIFGKWHFTKHPHDFDFDEAPKLPNDLGPANPKGIDTITDAACAFMEKNKDRPFLLYVPHNAPHVPHQARDATLAHFEAKKSGRLYNWSNIKGLGQWNNPYSDAIYAACVYDLDDGVGRLLTKLKELGLEENTVVVFSSDNGAVQHRDARLEPGASAGSDKTKAGRDLLRGTKGNYYESGNRVPLVVRWPGKIKPGTTCGTPVINVDLFPTFLAAAGVKTDKTLDGESLVPLLKQEGPLRRQAIFWHFPGYIDGGGYRGRERDTLDNFRSRPVSVIRKGDWKLMLFHEEWRLDGGREKLATNHAVELYNLAEDPLESKDLANANSGKRDELLDDLLAWFDAVDAKLPTEPNPEYDRTAESDKPATQ